MQARNELITQSLLAGGVVLLLLYIAFGSFTNLCLTVLNKNSRKGKGGDPLHNIKNIEFQNCKKDISKFQLWGIR